MTCTEGKLDANAKRSQDGKTLALQVVNPGDKALTAQIHISAFVPAKPIAQVTELAGQPDARNTASQPESIVPRQSQWEHGIKEGTANRAFAPHSITVLRFE